AVSLDPAAFEPFPLARFRPVRVLGAGGFGVTFLCEEAAGGRRVVVQALRPDTLDRDAGTLFREAAWLQDLDHPVLARVREVGHAGADAARPFLVRDYFEGQPLGQHVTQHGPFAPEEWLEIAWPLAR